MILAVVQIFELMRRAGFSVLLAIVMTAIALRESSGKPGAFNGDAATGDRSYGLLQINERDHNVAALMVKIGITDEKQLLDPAVNARAGFALWGGRNANLDEAWYITRPGYKERYEAQLPLAIAAALASSLGV